MSLSVFLSFILTFFECFMPKMDVSPVFWVFYVDQKESFCFFVFSQVENFLIFSFIILDTGRVVKCTLPSVLSAF